MWCESYMKVTVLTVQCRRQMLSKRACALLTSTTVMLMHNGLYLGLPINHCRENSSTVSPLSPELGWGGRWGREALITEPYHPVDTWAPYYHCEESTKPSMLLISRLDFLLLQLAFSTFSLLSPCSIFCHRPCLLCVLVDKLVAIEL